MFILCRRSAYEPSPGEYALASCQRQAFNYPVQLKSIIEKLNEQTSEVTIVNLCPDLLLPRADRWTSEASLPCPVKEHNREVG